MSHDPAGSCGVFFLRLFGHARPVAPGKAGISHNPAWQPELMAETVHRCLDKERSLTANLSLHCTAKWKPLAGQLEAFDLQRLAPSELQDNIEANFRQPSG